MKSDRSALIAIIALLVAASLVLASCKSTPTSASPSAPTRIPTITPIPLPSLTLKPGEFYFSFDDQPGFLFSRNMAGYEPQQYVRLLDLTSQGGSRMVRIQLDSMGTGITLGGEVDETWAQKWEQVLDKAAANRIYVILVFSGWFDWNNGTPDFGFSTWDSNSFNAANGGPAATPAELFQTGSPTQTMWLAWVEKLVTRWQDRENIAAWEIFSEVNIATGSTESTGIAFVEKAAALIRAADSSHRPMTASLADVGEWPNFLNSDAIDFINIHPYPPSAQLDRYLIREVPRYISTYNKPVLIGESGLSVDPLIAAMDNALRGVSHAIWAGLVSGAMNDRSLYIEDGFAIFYPNMDWPFLEADAEAELPAVRFIGELDFAGFHPLTVQSSAGIFGGAIGTESMVLGWFRDAACEPPDWNLQLIPAGQTVTLTVPGTAENWQVDFYDTKTGTTVLSSASVTRRGGIVTVTLPAFQDDIAFKMVAGAETSVITPEVVANTDEITGTWGGTISSSDETFSTLLELSIQPACEPGRVCGTFTAPQLPCSGELFLQEVDGDTFIFIEQNVTGASFCVSGGFEYLQLLPDGTLSYTYSFTPGSTDTTSGILRRP